MAAPLGGGRSRYTVLLLVLTCISLLTLDLRGFGPLETVQDGLRSAFRPLRSAADSAFEPVGDAWNGVFNYGDLEAENAELREEVAILQENAISDSAAREQLGELLREADIDYVDNIPTVLASVVSGPVGNFNDFVIEIDKGSNDGIEADLPVVTSGGLVGRVLDVAADSSTIVLITDPDFQLGVRLVDRGEVALARGAGVGAPLEITDGVDADDPVEVGTAIVTSGIRQSLFPAGVPVGEVSLSRVDEGALEQSLFVEPSADLDNLNFVSILLYRPGAP